MRKSQDGTRSFLLCHRNHTRLRRVLKAYADYYNNDRTHLSLDKDSPNGRAVEAVGKIAAVPILGGLHHRYRRVAPS